MRVDGKIEGWGSLSIEDGVTPSPAILSDQGTMASHWFMLGQYVLYY